MVFQKLCVWRLEILLGCHKVGQQNDLSQPPALPVRKLKGEDEGVACFHPFLTVVTGIPNI